MSIKNTATRLAVKHGAIAGAVASTFASLSTFAVDENVTAAVENASGNVSAVTAGVITISALGFGLSMIVSWLRK